MNNILVPCDFSQQSRAAYKTAIDWAAHSGGEVAVLHAIFPQVAYAGFGTESIVISPDYFSNIESRAKEEFEKMNREFNVPSIRSSLEISYGDLVASINTFIQSNSIDAVVMGTSGSSGIAEIFIGSNTEKVVRYSPVPVLAVREYADVFSIKNILFPTLLALDQTEFVKKLTEFQKFLSATLHILVVNSPYNFMSDNDTKGAFKEFVKHYKLSNYEYHFVNYRTEEEGILDFASTQKMDLIAMATHARKGLAHLFNGSLTENVVNHISMPIWTYALRKGKST